MAKKKRYGLPYMGAKGRLAERILALMPQAEHLYDLFAGGCAVSHCAMEQRRYPHIHINDISDIPQVFIGALNGKYDNEDRWISREDFFRLKDTAPYVRLVWSFSNNLKDYLYSREIEPFKKALHWAVYYKDPKPLSDFGIDASAAMTIEDRQERWLAVKHICSTPPPTSTTKPRIGFENHERSCYIRQLPPPPKKIETAERTSNLIRPRTSREGFRVGI